MFKLSFLILMMALPLMGFASDYNRKIWRHWADLDRDCQNTRNEILIRDSIIPVKFHSDKKCKVKSGEWFDPYTTTFFSNPRKLDIEHIIPLKNAHVSGGSSWSRKKKKQFANDQANLIAVSASENRRKGSRGPASYRPPNKAYWCHYAKTWIKIKKNYGLKFETAEKQALQSMVQGCGIAQ